MALGAGSTVTTTYNMQVAGDAHSGTFTLDLTVTQSAHYHESEDTTGGVWPDWK